jgi:hypothetical protein
VSGKLSSSAWNGKTVRYTVERPLMPKFDKEVQKHNEALGKSHEIRLD